MSSTTTSSQSSSSTSAPFRTTVSSNTTVNADLVKENDETIDEDLIELTAIDDLKDDWDMVADADIPIANSNVAEPDWETVRLATDMTKSNIDGEDYVAGDFTSSGDKKKLLVALGDAITTCRKMKDGYEEKYGVNKGPMIKLYEERAAMLSKAREIIEASMVA